MPDSTGLLMDLFPASVFILLSLLFIPFAGIQNDEALFVAPLYQPMSRDVLIRIFHHDIPLVLMSYLGTLKTLIYLPILKFFGPSVWSVRLPMVLAGALSVFLFLRLAQACRISRPAALCAGLFLASDPTFLLTSTFDWGPVALEHAFLTGACVLLTRFSHTDRRRHLFWGSFLLGLALWNKAIFLWALAGLVCGAAVVFYTEIRSLLSIRNIGLAAVGLLLGASPMVLYNLRHPAVTLHNNARLEFDAFKWKWLQVENAVNGSSLFGYLVAEESAPDPKPLQTGIGRAGYWLRQHIGDKRETLFYYVLGALLLAVPWWWRSRAARFSLIFIAVTWVAMAVTKDAGGSAHHVILLWPFPALFAAVTLARLPGKWVAPAVLAILIGMNLLVLNQYKIQFERNGAGDVFTDALLRLPDEVKEAPNQTVYVLDWGMLNTLDLFHEGRLKLRVGDEPLVPDNPSPAQVANFRFMIADPSAVFVMHTPKFSIYQQVAAHLEQRARELGYSKQPSRLVADSNGRPVFEIFRLAPSP